MRKEANLLVISLIFLIASSGCQTMAGFATDEKEAAIVTRITDGDTITIEGGARVRLLGINSPEKGERFYSEGKKFVEQQLLYKQIELERDVIDKDRYGRILRYVWLDGALVNAQIVRQGLAIAQVYEPNRKYSEEITEAERMAIDEKQGIWADAITSD